MKKEEIFDKVQSVLIDALGVEEEEVTNEAQLVNDLGAESIDFLDIVFRCEKRFGVKIPRGEFFPGKDFFDDPIYIGVAPDFSITARGIEKLQELMPWTDVRRALGDTPKLEDVQELFTVQFLCDFIDWKVN